MAGFDCTNESLVLNLVALLPISASSLVVITDIQNALLTPVNMHVRALNGHLKRLGIEYDKNGSTNSTRKVYRGIRKYSMSEMQEMNSDHSELLIDDDDPE